MKRKSYPRDFKLMVVEEYEAGALSLSALGKKYDIHPSLVLNWRRKAPSGGLTENTAELKAKDREVKRLRELAGKQALEIEFLKNAVHSIAQRRRRNGASSVVAGPADARSGGGAK